MLRLPHSHWKGYSDPRRSHDLWTQRLGLTLPSLDEIPEYLYMKMMMLDLVLLPPNRLPPPPGSSSGPTLTLNMSNEQSFCQFLAGVVPFCILSPRTQEQKASSYKRCHEKPLHLTGAPSENISYFLIFFFASPNSSTIGRIIFGFTHHWIQNFFCCLSTCAFCDIILKYFSLSFSILGLPFPG